MQAFEELKACHDRRTGHSYAGGCCGNGAYLVDGGGVEMVEDPESVRAEQPVERFVFKDGETAGGSGRGSRGGSRAGWVDDAKTIYLPGSYVAESRHGSARSGSHRPSHAASQHSSHRSNASSRSKYDRSEASGWLKPTARSERGVPAGVVSSARPGGKTASVAGTARSEGNTSSILPGESCPGFNDRQAKRRKRGGTR